MQFHTATPSLEMFNFEGCETTDCRFVHQRFDAIQLLNPVIQPLQQATHGAVGTDAEPDETVVHEAQCVGLSG